MKFLFLSGFSAYFGFLLWLWMRQWRGGEISRFPAFATIYRNKEPGRFRLWTIIHGIIFAAGFAILSLAWIALATGNLK